MRVYTLLVALYNLSHVVQARYSGKYCPLACETVSNYATYNDTNPSLPRQVRACRSKFRITSIYLCVDEFCSQHGDIERWIQEKRPWCDEHANITLPSFQEVVDGWTADAKGNVRRIHAAEALEFPYLNEVVIPDPQFFDRAYTTMETADWEYAIHLVYGWYMYYFWIVVIAIGITTRLLSLTWKLYYDTRTYRHLPGFSGGTLLKSWGIATLPKTWLKRYLTIPATFGTRCSQPYFGCTIPPRIQSFTIALFVILNLVLCSCSYRFTEGNLYWPKKSEQFLRFVSDRTGIISLANFPLVWLFGMRNDVLIWITGWGFGTYNAFHRWVARVATLQAVVHSLGYTLMILSDEGLSSFLVYWTKHYFWNGELATIAMCALLAFSFYGIRRAHYEMFLVTHIALSIATLWTMYYHVEIFTNGEWNIFIWPCVVIWIFDRVMRIGRILAFNRFPLNTKALITYDSKSNLVRMEVDGSNNLVAPKPGAYYYVHVLDNVLYAHQNHPFTLAYVSEDVVGLSTMPLSPLTDRSTPLSPSSDAEGELDELLASNTPNAPPNLVFLIRPYDGFTSRIKSHCLLHPIKLRVLIEGPYGHSIALHNFTNILFIVGGTGIAVPLSHLASILSSSSHVQSVKIVWAVREYAALVAVFRDFHGILSDERLDLEVHVTREEAKDDVLGEDMASVRIMTHRPDVHTTIEDAAMDAEQQPLAIVACGPALMADQARKASVQMLGRGHRGVEYFEESFKW